MPFDATQLRQPIVTVLPPTPERGERPRRVHIEIEIVDRRQQSPRGYRFGTITLWLLVVVLALMLAG